jgi:3',5'-cyclic AMP phosphodiesterase CpdA
MTPGPIRHLVHLSDLHFGATRRVEDATALLVDTIIRRDADHVVVTGDITEHGREDELARFCKMFEPLARSGRLTIVPGNHDRLGDDVGAIMMGGDRVRVERKPGLHLVLVDTTRPNPGFAFIAHGHLGDDDIVAIEAAIEDAEPNALVCVLMHHHLMALPTDSWFEGVGEVVGLPFAQHLARGPGLLQRLLGRVDLVLHGHRHMPRGVWIRGARRPLGVFNAGCSPTLGSFREFRHRDGRVVDGVMRGHVSELVAIPRPAA